MSRAPTRRPIDDSEKRKKVDLITSAIESGHKKCSAARTFGINVSTYLRWKEMLSREELDQELKCDDTTV
jgi:transposase-like protein